MNNQSTELSSSSESDNAIQEGNIIFKENPTVDLPEVSRLINSAISRRQGDQRKHSFLEKKNLHKRDKGVFMNTQKNALK